MKQGLGEMNNGLQDRTARILQPVSLLPKSSQLEKSYYQNPVIWFLVIDKNSRLMYYSG